MLNKTREPKILWIIFLTIIIDMIGLGILIPVFPMLVVASSPFRITPDNWTNHEGFIMIGWLMATYPLSQFFCTPILGQLSDKYGRRKILALSIIGTTISYLLFAIAILTKNIPLMFISRILDGVSGGNISVAQAIIGDVSAPEYRAKNFGLVGVAIGIGFVLGPFIGGRLSDPHTISWFNISTPFWFAAIISLINTILVLSILPETLKIKTNKPIQYTRPVNNIIKAFSYNQLKHIIPALFLFNTGFAFFSTFWGIVLADKFGLNSAGIGDYFAYSGIMIILAQGVLVRRLSGKVADYKVLRYSIAGSGISLIAYYLVPANHSFWIYYVPPFMAITVCLTKAFSPALITRVTDPEIRGEVMGINSSSLALAQAIPAMLAGYIATIHTALPVLVGGIVTICGGLLFRTTFQA